MRSTNSLTSSSCTSMNLQKAPSDGNAAVTSSTNPLKSFQLSPSGVWDDDEVTELTEEEVDESAKEELEKSGRER